jgi:nicotinamide mononucleotide transporter
MSFLEIIEICAVAFNLIYLFLLIRENIWCWLNGIVASLLSIYLFFEAKLYSECILYGFYVIIGVYGWLVWAGKISKQEGKQVVRKGLVYHFVSLIIGASGMVLLGWWFSSNTDAKQPWHDAFSTSFSFVASFLEAHKVLSAWLYWIVLNLFSVWLYKSRNLDIYAGLMLVYFLASVWGYYEWRKKYLATL